MKNFNQFDMEQQIMTCWNVCEDLDTLTEGVLDRGMTTDQISNVLIGMKELYQLKFEKLWEHFEALCAQKVQVTETTLFDHLEGFHQGRESWDNMNNETTAKGEVL